MAHEGLDMLHLHSYLQLCRAVADSYHITANNLVGGWGCRGAWEASGEVRDQQSKQRQMMADGNLRGFWSKQGRCRLKKYAPTCVKTS